MPIHIGDTAPDFSLQDENGLEINLASFRGDASVILVFYPADNTSGWTRQLSALRDDKVKFDGMNTRIFGVNPASGQSHKRFSEKYSFNFPLLIDSERSVAAEYGALKENGKSIERTVFIVDKEGKVAFAKKGMPSDDELIATLEALDWWGLTKIDRCRVDYYYAPTEFNVS